MRLEHLVVLLTLLTRREVDAGVVRAATESADEATKTQTLR